MFVRMCAGVPKVKRSCAVVCVRMSVRMCGTTCTSDNSRIVTANHKGELSNGVVLQSICVQYIRARECSWPEVRVRVSVLCQLCDYTYMCTQCMRTEAQLEDAKIVFVMLADTLLFAFCCRLVQALVQLIHTTKEEEIVSSYGAHVPCVASANINRAALVGSCVRHQNKMFEKISW